MDSMFAYYNGTEIDISDWDTSNITSARCLFSGRTLLVDIIGEFDLSNLTDGLGVLTYDGYSFSSCSKLETLYLKNIYKNCTMTNDSKWGIYLGDTKVKDECLIYIINELPDLINDKGLTATDKIVLTLPKTNTLTESDVAVATSKGWTCANTTY